MVEKPSLWVFVGPMDAPLETEGFNQKIRSVQAQRTKPPRKILRLGAKEPLSLADRGFGDLLLGQRNEEAKSLRSDFRQVSVWKLF